MAYPHPNQPPAVPLLPIDAGAVLRAQFDPRAYPYRYLMLKTETFGTQGATEILAAAEALGQVGWELVSVTHLDQVRALVAYLRRL